MGGVASAVGGFVGDIAGGLVGGIADKGGIRNSFQGQNPIDQAAYNNQLQTLQGQQQGTFQDQQALAQALLAQSHGQGPNPAQLLMQQGMDNANKQGAGMLASARGMNPALAARMVGQNNAANQQHMAQNAGIMGAQQQLAAQGQLGSLYGQMGQQNLQNQGMLNNALLQGSLGSQQLSAGAADSNAKAKSGLLGGLLQGGGAMGAAALAASSGGKIGGHANVAGDSPSNDTVHAMLSPGEIVIPRSKAGDPDLAKEFIDHLMKREGKRKKGA